MSNVSKGSVTHVRVPDRRLASGHCGNRDCRDKAHRHWRIALSYSDTAGKRRQKTAARFHKKSEAQDALDSWRSALKTDPSLAALSYGDWRNGKSPTVESQVQGVDQVFRNWAVSWLEEKVASHDHRGTTAEAAAKYLIGKPSAHSTREPGTCIAEAVLPGGVAFGDLQMSVITHQHVHDAIRAEAGMRTGGIYRTYSLRGWSYFGQCLRKAASDFDLDPRIYDRDRVQPPKMKQVEAARAKTQAARGTDTRLPWQTWDLHTAATVLGHVQKEDGSQWFAIVKLVLDVGLRRSEVCGLQWRNVDLNGRRLHVRGPRASCSETSNGAVEFNPPKSKAGTRTLVLPVKVADALRTWAIDQAVLHGIEERPDQGFVFTGDNGSHWRPKTLSDLRWKAITRELSDRVPVVTFHGLRKVSGAFGLSYFGEDLYAVARRLGHSNITVTQDHYAYLNLDRAETFADARDQMMAL